MHSSRPDPGVSRKLLPVRVVFAACFGNALEFYSVTVYAFVAVTLSPIFFPHNDPAVSMLLTFGMFGISYLVRPIGGIVIGAYGDRKGRRAALLLSLEITLAGTVVMIATPSYDTIGIWAPLLVLVARIMQGFALGGELGTATAYLMEQGPVHRKPLFASLQLASQGLGGIVAATAGVIFTNLAPVHRASWGWRGMLAMPLLLAPIGVYIRKRLDESYEFLSVERAKVSTARLMYHYRSLILLSAATIAALTANIYFRVYLPAFVSQTLGLPEWSPFVLMYITSIINMIVVPVVARISTPENSRKIMIVALLLLTIAVWPAIVLVTRQPSVTRMLVGCSILTVLGAIYSAPQSYIIARIFPTQVRSVGVATSYNVAVLAFGGFAPAIYSGLVQLTGNPRSPAIYLLGACAVSFVSLFFLPDQTIAPPAKRAASPVRPALLRPAQAGRGSMQHSEC